VGEDDALIDAGQRGQRALVRRGYDAISLAYCGDDGQAAGSEDVTGTSAGSRSWPGLLRPGGRVLDLGCGAGIPATRELTGHGLQVIGVDFSVVQLSRARRPAWCRRTWRSWISFRRA